MTTVIRNAQIFTGNIKEQGLSTATCLVVEDGHITYVGDENNAAVTNASGQVLDLQGHVVAPSFIDG